LRLTPCRLHASGVSTIVNLRGTNGSGKSTAVRQLMDLVGVAEELKRDGKVWAYRLQNKVSVLGRYETACGGAEALTFKQIAAGVSELAEQDDVMFEGFLWGTVFKSSHEFAKTTQHKVIFALLDTPVELCVERTIARRHAAGNSAPFDSANLREKWDRTRRQHLRLRDAGHDCRDLRHDDAVAMILAWLGR
jgi:hypothetical protein